MKKFLLSWAVLAAAAGAAHAQESRLGFKAGISFASYAGSDKTSSSSSKVGFHGGLVANLGLNDRFSLQPELLYSMKGVADQLTLGTTTITGHQTLHYVDLPVLLKATFGRLFVEAGPQVGVLVGATQTIESSASTAGTSTANKSTFNDVDFGYALGLGVQTATGLMAGLRYNGGFANVVRGQTYGGRTVQPNVHNSAFQLYIGFLFGGK